MSVTCQTEFGAILDHNSFFRRIYSQCMRSDLDEDDKPTATYQMKSDFFQIKSVFMMDSRFNKLKAKDTQIQVEAGDTLDVPFTKHTAQHPKRRKKRKLAEMSGGQLKIQERHMKIRETLQKAHEQLVTLARQWGHLLPAEGAPSDNNIIARRAAETVIGPGDTLREMCQTATDCGAKSHTAVTLNMCEKEQPLWFNTLVVTTSDKPSVRSMLGDRYLIPAQCTFLMSDISHLDPLIGTNNEIDARKYDVIVMDPPWFNKSVKRKHKYKMVNEQELLNIPMPHLASTHGLIVVWATNKIHQHEFIKDELFTKWKVKHLATWYWLKVTQHGEIIAELDSTQKKPYETIFLGYKTDSTEDCSGDPPPCLSKLPDLYTIISVPSSVHSHKPPLTEILKPYLPESPKCLELFARNLLPGWTSCGNEVLKLQHMDYFEPVAVTKTP